MLYNKKIEILNYNHILEENKLNEQILNCKLLNQF